MPSLYQSGYSFPTMFIQSTSGAITDFINTTDVTLNSSVEVIFGINQIVDITASENEDAISTLTYKNGAQIQESAHSVIITYNGNIEITESIILTGKSLTIMSFGHNIIIQPSLIIEATSVTLISPQGSIMNQGTIDTSINNGGIYIFTALSTPPIEGTLTAGNGTILVNNTLHMSDFTFSTPPSADILTITAFNNNISITYNINSGTSQVLSVNSFDANIQTFTSSTLNVNFPGNVVISSSLTIPSGSVSITAGGSIKTPSVTPPSQAINVSGAQSSGDSGGTVTLHAEGDIALTSIWAAGAGDGGNAGTLILISGGDISLAQGAGISSQAEDGSILSGGSNGNGGTITAIASEEINITFGNCTTSDLSQAGQLSGGAGMSGGANGAAGSILAAAGGSVTISFGDCSTGTMTDINQKAGGSGISSGGNNHDGGNITIICGDSAQITFGASSMGTMSSTATAPSVGGVGMSGGFGGNGGTISAISKNNIDITFGSASTADLINDDSSIGGAGMSGGYNRSGGTIITTAGFNTTITFGDTATGAMPASNLYSGGAGLSGGGSFNGSDGSGGSITSTSGANTTITFGTSTAGENSGTGNHPGGTGITGGGNIGGSIAVTTGNLLSINFGNSTESTDEDLSGMAKGSLYLVFGNSASLMLPEAPSFGIFEMACLGWLNGALQSGTVTTSTTGLQTTSGSVETYFVYTYTAPDSTNTNVATATLQLNNTRVAIGAFSIELWNNNSMHSRLFYKDEYGTTSPLGPTTSLYGNPIANSDATKNYDLTAPADFLPTDGSEVAPLNGASYVLTGNITEDTYIVFVSQLILTDANGFPILENPELILSSVSGSVTATATTPNNSIISGTIEVTYNDTTNDLTTFDITNNPNAAHFMITSDGLVAYVAAPFPLNTYGAAATVQFNIVPILA